LLSAQETAVSLNIFKCRDIHMNHANYDDAIQAYQEALKIDPSNQQAREGLRKPRQLQETLKSIIK